MDGRSLPLHADWRRAAGAERADRSHDDTTQDAVISFCDCREVRLSFEELSH
jgi:hypothetical protein